MSKKFLLVRRSPAGRHLVKQREQRRRLRQLRLDIEVLRISLL